MTRASDTVHEAGAPRESEPLRGSDGDSPALEHFAAPAGADDLTTYAREPMDAQSTAAFKAWTLAIACRNTQGWR
jgi:hypothetical protein